MPSDLLFTEAPPQPIRLRGTVHIGTSGFSFPDWSGVFYPERLSRSEWLKFYSREFTVVEINATYYRIPPASTFARMAEATPDDFGFWVKIPGEVTHKNGPITGSVPALRLAIAPLQEAGKLRGVLAQFPNAFRPAKAAWERITELNQALEGIPLAVEFRRSDWLTDDTFDRLYRLRAIYVAVDMPAIATLPPTVPDVTAGIGYARLHGRNAATWYDREKGDRYDYDYSKAELLGLTKTVRQLDRKAATSYIFFNNCHLGQAVKNARMLRELLRLESADE